MGVILQCAEEADPALGAIVDIDLGRINPFGGGVVEAVLERWRLTLAVFTDNDRQLDAGSWVFVDVVLRLRNVGFAAPSPPRDRDKPYSARNTAFRVQLYRFAMAVG